MERVMFYDIETTGLPERNWHWSSDYDLFPYIVEIAWKTCQRIHSYIINQEGRKIPSDVIKIHGITNEMCAESPYTFRHIVPLFLHDAEQSELIVGHNLYFDTSIFKANVIREFGKDSAEAKRAIAALDKSKRRDTLRMAMKMKMGFLGLPALHSQLFGTGYEGHRAVNDLLAVERCYCELLKRNGQTVEA